MDVLNFYVWTKFKNNQILKKANLELSSQTLVKTFKSIRNQQESFCDFLTWFVIIIHNFNFKFRITKFFRILNIRFTLFESVKLIRNQRKSFCDSLIRFVIVIHDSNFEFRIKKNFESSKFISLYLIHLKSFVINENPLVTPLYDS